MTLKNLVEYLEDVCRRDPDRMLFSFEEATYSYVQVRDLVDRRAKELAEGEYEPYGYAVDGHLVIDAPNSTGFVITLLAAFSLGVPAVLLNHRLTDLEKEERLGLLPAVLPDDAAVIIFTSGTTGLSKPVALTQANIIGSALAANRLFGHPREDLWQLVLPLYHVSGLGMLARTITNGSSFILYERYNADRILADARRWHATHISVVDKILRDMLQSDPVAVASYQVLLLGGGPLNDDTLMRARTAHAKVYASYGMTETSSMMAASLLTDAFDGGLALLEGYEVRILDPDEHGVGELAVYGPGVTRDYLIADSQAYFTADGFLLTGDRARRDGDLLYLRERLKDQFISGGENIYPAQIERRIKLLPGVEDAVVIGVSDSTWGRVPVAFVIVSGDAAFDLDAAQATLARELSPYERPRDILVLDRLPGAMLGKVDRRKLEEMYQERIDTTRVILREVSQPFNVPFQTAQGRLEKRVSLLVEVHDARGNVGYGEDVAFETDWYQDETIADGRRALEQVLIPRVLETCYLVPDEVSGDLTKALATKVEDGVLAGPVSGYSMALAALENALWDLYGHVTGKSMRELVGGDAARCARAGFVVGVAPIKETLSVVREAVAAGYSRIKVKISPDRDDVARIRALRDEFPDLLITLDANRSFSVEQVDLVEAYAPCGITFIEEPFAVPPAREDADERFRILSQMQSKISILLCVDESATCAEDAYRALAFDNLRMFVLKIGRMGGIGPSLDFLKVAQDRGATVWMGGMFDTSISKRLHAIFEQIAGVDIPGDIVPATRYFPHDLACPPLEVIDGKVLLSEGPGLGIELDRGVLAGIEVSNRSFTSEGYEEGELTHER